MTATILMRQTMPNTWNIESQSGAVLQKGVVAVSHREALDYIKNYASSYPGWTYNIVPMQDTKVDKLNK